MKLFYSFSILVYVTILSGCSSTTFLKSSGTIKERSFFVRPYHHLEIEGGCKVVLTRSEQGEIQVFAGEKIISDIDINSENDRLYISFEKVVGYNLEGTIVKIPASNLKTLSTKKATILTSQSPLFFETLSCSFQGASIVNLELDVKKLGISIDGSSDLNLKGSSDEFDLHCNGTSDVCADKFACKNIFLDVEGVSDLSLFCEDSIKGRVRGVSDVTIYGMPKSRMLKQSGDSFVNFK